MSHCIISTVMKEGASEFSHVFATVMMWGGKDMGKLTCAFFSDPVRMCTAVFANETASYWEHPCHVGPETHCGDDERAKQHRKWEAPSPWQDWNEHTYITNLHTALTRTSTTASLSLSSCVGSCRRRHYENAFPTTIMNGRVCVLWIIWIGTRRELCCNESRANTCSDVLIIPHARITKSCLPFSANFTYL